MGAGEERGAELTPEPRLPPPGEHFNEAHSCKSTELSINDANYLKFSQNILSPPAWGAHCCSGPEKAQPEAVMEVTAEHLGRRRAWGSGRRAGWGREGCEHQRLQGPQGRRKGNLLVKTRRLLTSA